MWVVAGFPGGWATFFYFPWDKGTTKHKWGGKAGDSFVWANFQGNSRASFADYTGGKRVVTTSSVYSCITTFLFTQGGVLLITPASCGGRALPGPV